MAGWSFSYEARAPEIDLWAELRETLDPDPETDTGPAIVENPEFFHPIEDVIESVSLLEFGILPEAGGWLDQNEFWARDVRLYMRMRSRVLWERAQALKDDQKKDPLDVLLGAEPDNAADWDAFTKG